MTRMVETTKSRRREAYLRRARAVGIALGGFGLVMPELAVRGGLLASRDPVFVVGGLALLAWAGEAHLRLLRARLRGGARGSEGLTGSRDP